MQTLTAINNKGVFPGLLIMPGLVAVTGFHGRKDMHQAGMATASFQNRLNAVFLAKILDFANKLYLDPILRGHTLGIGTDRLSKRISQFIGIIKDSDFLSMQDRCHSLRKAPNGDSSPQDNAIVAGKIATDLLFILFSNHFYSSIHGRAYPLFYNVMDEVITNFLVPACPG